MIWKLVFWIVLCPFIFNAIATILFIFYLSHFKIFPLFSDYFSLPMLLKLFTKRCYSSAPLYMMLNWQGLLRSCLSQTARWQWVIILCTNPLGRLFCLSFRCENNDLHHCKKYNDTRKDFMTNKIIRIWYINKISSFILLTPLTNTCWELQKIQNWIRSYFYMQSSLSQEHSMC